MRGTIKILTLLIITFGVIVGTKYYDQQTIPLIEMMQNLLVDMQQVDEGIYTENFDIIEEGAAAIADHPPMTGEDKKLVKKTLGEEMQNFVTFDKVVHHHADSMRIAAVQESMNEVLRHYVIVQQGCVSCHSSFRQRISDARSNQ